MAYILRLSSFVRDFFLPGPKILSLREAFNEEEKNGTKMVFYQTISRFFSQKYFNALK